MADIGEQITEFFTSSIITTLKNKWEKIIGLLAGNILIVVLFLYHREAISQSGMPQLCTWYTLVACILVLSVFWAISTSRIPLPTSSDIRIAIHIVNESGEYDKDAKEFVKKAIQRVRACSEGVNIKFDLLPINHFSYKSEIEKYIQDRRYAFAGIVSLEFHGGKINGSEQYRIKEITYYSQFKVADAKKNYLMKRMDSFKELVVKPTDNKWLYIKLNDFYDKDKFCSSLAQSFAFFAGFDLVNMEKFDKSIEALNALQKLSTNNLTNQTDEESKQLEEFSMATTSIIVDLYSRFAANRMEVNDRESVVTVLERCEQSFGENRYSFLNKINLACLCFELGKMEDARRYHKICMELAPTHPFVLINKGWFAMIDGDEKSLAEAYGFILRKGLQPFMNALGVVEFINRYKEQYAEREIMMEFMEAFLYKFGIDFEEGHKMLIFNRTRLGKYPNLDHLAKKAIYIGQAKVVRLNEAKKLERKNRG